MMQYMKISVILAGLSLAGCMNTVATSLPRDVAIENAVAACIEYRMIGTVTKTESAGRIIYIPAAGPMIDSSLEEISSIVAQLCP